MTPDARCAALTRAGSRVLEIRRAVVEPLPRGGTACRVEAVARPRPRARIGVEIWLPVRWSGRYYQMGNGGFAGRIDRPTLAAAAARGDVAAATDTGHTGGGFDAGWAAGRPDLVRDYAYRSIKVTADTADRLVRLYHGRPARRRFYMGCSYGGRQALTAAARWPRDWDGVIAGAPAYDWPRVLTGFARIARAVPRGGAVLRRAVAREGYHPDEIDARDRRRWITPSDPAAPSQRRLTIEAHRHLFGASPTWTPERGPGPPVPAWVRDAFAIGDLRPYLRAGGKVLIYFGRADPVLPPASASQYRRTLVARVGAGALARSYRLFTVPGMGHCQGGDAPHAFGQSIAAAAPRDDAEHDVRRAIERWVEQGVAPDRLIAGDPRPGPPPASTNTRILRPVTGLGSPPRRQ